MRRTVHVRVIVFLVVICIVLYFLSVPIFWKKYDSPTGKKAVMWCSLDGSVYTTFTWEGMRTEFTPIFEGKKSPNTRALPQLQVVNIARFSCRKCGAQKTEYYHEDKTVFIAVSGLNREMCLSPEHDWEVVSERKSSEEEIHNPLGPGSGMLFKPYALLGILLLFLFSGADISTLARFREDDEVTLRYILRRVVPIVILGSLTIIIGFVGTVSDTIRFVELNKDSGYGPSVKEMCFLVLDSNWLILGMALFTILVTVITAMIIYYLRSKEKQV